MSLCTALLEYPPCVLCKGRNGEINQNKKMNCGMKQTGKLPWGEPFLLGNWKCCLAVNAIDVHSVLHSFSPDVLFSCIVSVQNVDNLYSFVCGFMFLFNSNTLHQLNIASKIIQYNYILFQQDNVSQRGGGRGNLVVCGGKISAIWNSCV